MDEVYIDSNGNKYIWDSNKNDLNIKNHGISFVDAIRVFDDIFYIEQYDSYHSNIDECRYKNIGMIDSRFIVTIITTDRNGYKRVISSWEATPMEKEVYYDNYANAICYR